MFNKILIANRGEIAVRVIRACREMGIKTVAVYSEADRDALHMQLADEAVCIGPAKATDSYLDMQSILSAAVVTKAQAIHPGFGFLSENSTFATMCEELNIAFIGPKPETIYQMGDKANARELMIEAEVPVIPGSDGFIHTYEEAKTEAEKLGYPVMLKASAGGGGKGMRRVANEEELETAYINAKSEAKAAFGNDAMYMEKIIEHARHIEVQVLGDKHGNVIHLGERDCSLQRNNQKVIEESPSVAIQEEQRQLLGATAVRAAKYVQYENAGTIEFLLDVDGNYYFMEMNTRIQVEHPVTEMATEIDLVKQQILIAAGNELKIQQADVRLTGHTIECRINAENPAFHFAPSPGKVDYLLMPAGGLGLRIESAMFQGAEIPPYYDAMIAKVIVKGADRQEAIAKMKRALSEMVIEGVITNQYFQEDLLNDENFVNGNYDTSYLETDFLQRWTPRMD